MTHSYQIENISDPEQGVLEYKLKPNEPLASVARWWAEHWDNEGDHGIVQGHSAPKIRVTNSDTGESALFVVSGEVINDYSATPAYV